MDSRRTLLMVAVIAAVAVGAPSAAASAKRPPHAPTVRELATFAAPGCIRRLRLGQHGRPRRRAVRHRRPGRPRPARGSGTPARSTTFATACRPRSPRWASAERWTSPSSTDTAYVLVTLVGPSSGSPTWSTASTGSRRTATRRRSRTSARGRSRIRPRPDFFVDSGVQYALQAFRGGFLVTDGHHNRVLRVSRAGDISAADRVRRRRPYRARRSVATRSIWERPARSRISRRTARSWQFTPRSPREGGGRPGSDLIVDVEFGRGHRLYALSQGIWDLPVDRRRTRDAGIAEHRERSCASSVTAASRSRRRRPGPADLAGVRAGYRLRGHADGQGHEDRRRVALRSGGRLGAQA